MSSSNNYRPHIPKDENYLNGIAQKIGKNPGAIENVLFENLSDIATYLGLQNPFAFNTFSELNLFSEELCTTMHTMILDLTKTDNMLREKLYALWDYLAESDPIEPSDLIFVFGGPAGEYRAKEAIRLYKEGYAPKILFTGQKSSFMKDVDMTEAAFYKKLALQAGVKNEDIIMEELAINTPENAIYSLKILEQINYVPKSAIAITLNYHMRRSYFTLKSSSLGKIKILRDSITPPGFEREGYFLSKELFQYVFYEYIKMYGARLMGHF